MNTRYIVPTQMSHFVFRLILFILLLSVLMTIMNHPTHSINMPLAKNDSGLVLPSAGQAKPHAVPVPTPPANTALRPAAATPVPTSSQPVPVPQPVPTPPAGR